MHSTCVGIFLVAMTLHIAPFYIDLATLAIIGFKIQVSLLVFYLIQWLDHIDYMVFDFEWNLYLKCNQN